MDVPSNTLRQEVGGMLDGLPSEEELETILISIESAIHEEIREHPPEEDANGVHLISAIDAWASLASHAAAHVYAPASPWPRWPGDPLSALVGKTRQLSGSERSVTSCWDHYVSPPGCSARVHSPLDGLLPICSTRRECALAQQQARVGVRRSAPCSGDADAGRTRFTAAVSRMARWKTGRRATVAGSPCRLNLPTRVRSPRARGGV
jgi:hypothetical protein